MRGTLLSIAVVFAIGCGGNHGQSVCENSVPPPPACMQACDSQPGAPNTCPAGYHCTEDGHCDALCTPAGGECGDGYICTSDGRCQGVGECTGLQCQVTHCESMGMPPTSIKGTIFAPNGTLPLYGVTVYVPNTDPGALPDGAVCNKCSDTLPGDPIVSGTSIEDGTFEVDDIPDGDNIPVVIVSGKWRRQITIPHVTACANNDIGATDTSLPKSMTDITANTKSVDMPKIALSTGSADSLECLLRKLGIDDKEIGTGGGAQKIHLWNDAGSTGKGVGQFKSGFPGGNGAFTDSKNLWDTFDHMKPYDVMILSCEGGQHDETKKQTDMDAVKAYADYGGRVFLSHWHNIWIEGDTEGGTSTGAPAVWPSIVTWSNGGNYGGNDTIDEVNNPKGMAFATWMLNVMGSTVRDQIVLTTGTGRSTVASIPDNTKAERWVYTASGGMTPQNFQFTTPNEADEGSRCGKVVFSDMHVSGGPGGGDYPDGCPAAGTALTPQEKALAFMIFDLSSCVGSIF